MSWISKNLVISVLGVIALILAYRVFDLGVTLSFTEDELLAEQRATHVVSKFNRLPCDSLDRETREKYQIFEKEGFTFIEGLRFSCKESSGGGKALHFDE